MKKFLIPIFVVLLLVFFYVYYTSSSGRAPVLISQNPNGTAESEVVGAEIIALVEQLSTVKLDTALFQKETFQSLRDFSISLRPQPIGRPNPFAPIGQDGQATVAAPTASPASSGISQVIEEGVVEDASGGDFFDDSSSEGFDSGE